MDSVDLIHLNKKGQLITKGLNKLLINNIKDGERCNKRGHEYVVKKYDSFHKRYELQRVWEDNKKALVKYEEIDFSDPHLFLVINYLNNQSDTLALSPFSLKYNFNNYKLNDKIIWQMSKYLPKYEKEYVRYMFGLREILPKENKIRKIIKEYWVPLKKVMKKFW